MRKFILAWKGGISINEGHGPANFAIIWDCPRIYISNTGDHYEKLSIFFYIYILGCRWYVDVPVTGWLKRNCIKRYKGFSL